MQYLISTMLVIVGIVHLLPLSGVFGGEKLSLLYGLPLDETNIAILMRHRAVLFGILGLFFVFAAFKPAYQPLAFIAGFASVVSFLLLARSAGEYNAQIARVFAADMIALLCLIIAVSAYLFTQIKR